MSPYYYVIYLSLMTAKLNICEFVRYVLYLSKYHVYYFFLQITIFPRLRHFFFFNFNVLETRVLLKIKTLMWQWIFFFPKKLLLN